MLRGWLGGSLPEYMVPSAFHWRERLPLTANSKIDKKTLTKLGRPAHRRRGPTMTLPRTPTERRLAAAWAKVLGIPQHQVGRNDHFFDRGGTSLSAVKLAVNLGRALSFKEVTAIRSLPIWRRWSTADPMRQSELLQALSESDGAQAGALVCFPYAGGNAVNFQPMARALRDSGLAVYAVELPGHDIAAGSESFAPMERVVEQVVAEINRRSLTAVLLWGHSSGAALAVETARRLEQAGTRVPRVFLGAQLLGAAADRRAAVTELGHHSNAEISARLTADSGYTELGELDAARAEHVGAAYRHDYVSANRYFAEVLDDPPPQRLSAPVTVVVAADDPSTAGFRAHHRDWELLAEHVELHELADGGHYFPRTRPAEAAQAVLQSAGMLVSLMTVNLKGAEMSSLPLASLLDMELKLASLRSCGPRRPATRPAGRPNTGTRCAHSWPSTARFWSVASGCATPPRPPQFSGSLAGNLMIEKEAFARRQVYADGVYSSATWPANQPMCMHHELSYRLEVPSLLLFACLGAPTTGWSHRGVGFADRTGRAAQGLDRAFRAGRLDAYPQLQRRDRGNPGGGVRDRGPQCHRKLLPCECDRVRVATRRRTAHPAAPQRCGASPGHRSALLLQPDRLPERVDDRPRGA